MQTCVIDTGAYSIKHGVVLNDTANCSGPQEMQVQPLCPFFDTQRNVLLDADMLEHFYLQIVQENNFLCQENVTLLTCAASQAKQTSEKMVQILFETLACAGGLLVNSAAMALLAHNATTGIVLDSGMFCTQSIALIEGYTNKFSLKQNGLAGDVVTSMIRQDVMMSYQVADQIKCQVGHVAIDSTTMVPAVQYKLPDGTLLDFDSAARLKMGEQLFCTWENGTDWFGKTPAEMIFNSIMNTDPMDRKDMYYNVCLVGGTTMLPGYTERIIHDVTNLKPYEMRLRILPSKIPRAYATWYGAAMKAQTSTFAEQLVTFQDYEEIGPNIVSNMYL